MTTVVLCTGGFDPLHSGHIAYFKAARQLGDKLVVGLNGDDWLARKKGQAFMPLNERTTVIEHLNMVDHVILFDDSDDSSIEAIKNTLFLFPEAHIIFANGGDRNNENIPEMVVNDPRVSFAFGVGGSTKRNSSSWILDAWKNAKTIRPWGWYKVLDDKGTHKVKELVIEPGKKMSMQRHKRRAEHWYILSGECDIMIEHKQLTNIIHKEMDEYFNIPIGRWHQGQNNSTVDCHILEIQAGTACIEEDIERKDA